MSHSIDLVLLRGVVFVVLRLSGGGLRTVAGLKGLAGPATDTQGRGWVGAPFWREEI